MKRRLERRVAAVLGAAMACACAIGFSSVSTGCYECAEYDEYCVELDCCDEYTCVYDETAGYRCR